MKKIIFTSCLLAMAATQVWAQKDKTDETPFHKGSGTIALGMGLGVDYNYFGTVNSAPSGVAFFDYGIKDGAGPGNIGAGAIVALKTARFNYPDGSRATWTNVIVGLRGTWHLTLLAAKNNKFDPYAGAMVGLRFQGYKNTYYDNHPYLVDYYSNHPVTPTAGFFVGAKYNFTPHFGAWTELGYDVAYFKIGLNYNL
jgi:hypothetical protein